MSSAVPEGWGNLPVAEVFEVGRGRVISKDEIRDNAGRYPVFSSQSKNNGEMGRLDSYDFDGEYVTWTTDGAYAGTVFHRSGRFNCTNVCGTLRDKGVYAVDMRFASEYLSTVAKNHVSYVGNPKLMNGIFGEIDLLLPPLPEQKKIASILTSVDEVIENTQKQIDKLQDLKKATMNELLTKGIGHTEFKDSELGRIPKSWDVRTLGVVCQKIQDGTHFSPTTGGGSYKYLTSKNIRMGKLSLSKIETISESQHREIYKRCDVKFGDILLTKDGANTGNVAINILEEEFSLLSSVAFIRPSESAQTHFLLQYLMSDTAQSLMSELMSGNAITRLTLQKIKAFPLPLPPASEQTDIYLPLTAIDKQSLNLEAKKRQTQSLKKSLMQDLLTGKVRVTVN